MVYAFRVLAPNFCYFTLLMLKSQNDEDHTTSQCRQAQL